MREREREGEGREEVGDETEIKRERIIVRERQKDKIRLSLIDSPTKRFRRCIDLNRVGRMRDSISRCSTSKSSTTKKFDRY